MDESILENNDETQDFNSRVTTPSGVFYCTQDTGSPLTLHGYLPHFAQFLHESGQLEEFISNCPLVYKSNNAPEVKDVLGTIILSVLSGHTRYSHMSSLCGDEIAADLLDMNKIMSHDSIQRGLDKMLEKDAQKWLDHSFRKMYEPLLTAPYILDLDPTVKVMYGQQEGAEIGYNPQKPGRPSQSYHTYFIGNLRLVLDVEIHSGKEVAGRYSHPRLWSLIDSMPVQCIPHLIRGDIGFGNQETMLGCEERNLFFLFKLKQTKNIKSLILSLEKLGGNWESIGQGWFGSEGEIQLMGWSKARRVVVLRRAHFKKKNLELPADCNQRDLPIIIEENESPKYEYQVLITNTDYEISALAQLYRDRGDCENNFDELKNQWGWAGFSSQSLKRAQIMARIIALVYDWWNIFCRLAEPEKHMEAITSRKLFQNTIGRMSNSGGKRLVHITAMGAQAQKTLLIFCKISKFIADLCLTAAQLSKEWRWKCILREAFKVFLDKKEIRCASDKNQILLNL